MMLPARIIYQSDYVMLAYEYQQNSWQCVAQFNTDETGQRAFIDYLCKQLHLRLIWFVDSSQESHYCHSVPHVQGGDKKRLLQQRKQRIFSNTPYVTTSYQGREQQGRRDDEILFSGLSNPHVLHPWLPLIQACNVPLQGIYSIPLLQQHLFIIPELKQYEYVLISSYTPAINAHTKFGLRQTLFIKQKTKFSRLVALEEDSVYPEHVSSQIIKHLQTTQQYIKSINLLPNNTPLQLITILPAALCNKLEKYFVSPNHRVMNHHDISPHADYYTHELILTVLSSWKIRFLKNHYAQVNERQSYRLGLLRRSMNTISILLLGVAVFFTGESFWKSWKVQQATKVKMQQIVDYQQELKQLRLDAPKLPLDFIYLRNMVDTGRYLQKRFVMPEVLWVRLSHILVNYPMLQLQKLLWEIGHNQDTLFKQNHTGTNTNEVMMTSNRFGRSQILYSEDKTKLVEGIKIYGTIAIEEENYVQQLKKFQHFIKTLKESKTWSVHNIIAPDHTYIGNNAPFSVELIIAHDKNPHLN